ncbi:cytochrome c peroxidase [Marivirga sp.]|uniref:cytochrome-c peroxidase n=1 Tax=Marivirga sp. TaxID=2018662 RepID=UPI0025FA71B1|nr:cytochrome c peroxidase [Marivirga sp.]
MERFCAKPIILVIISLGLLILGCEEKETSPSLTDYQLNLPKHFPIMKIPQDNPLTEEGVLLGRKLYYDPILSEKGPFHGNSCSSCHIQSEGFTVEGSTILPHQNLGWQFNFLWDGKISGKLEDVMMFEVEEFFKTDVELIQTHAEYSKMFEKVYNISASEIKAESIAKSLAQFIRSLNSSNSKFDHYLEQKVNLTDSEMRGLFIFNTEKGDCFHCHQAPLFTDLNFHNIGLDSAFNQNNSGLAIYNQNTFDIGKYKTPSLRNVGIRTSFMHDGRFKSLEEVIEHYNKGVKRSPYLDPIMFKNQKMNGLNLSEQDKKDLIAFLNTLTDEAFLTNELYSNPYD